LVFLLASGLVYSPSLLSADSFTTLMYHRFGEDKFPSTSIRMEQFEAHLEHLKEKSYNPITLEQALAFIRDGAELPDKAVLITIDDAYLTVYTEAYPLFQEYGFPFAVFVATDGVDDGLRAYMSWDQMREMEANGVAFANHGAAHVSTLEREESESEADWLARVKADVDKGWQRLSEELNPVPGAFAYPYGEYDERTAQILVDAGYISFGQQSGATGALSDVRSLPRFPMNENYADMSGFRTKVASVPLPVTSVSPWNPLTTERMPSIEVALAETDNRIMELACFVSGQGKVDIDWVEPGKKFRVGPVKSFAKGRSRVNCTAPTNSGRYRWFSHPWVIE